MKNTAFILAGILLLLVGGAVVFYILKRKEIATVKKAVQSGVAGDAENIISSGIHLFDTLKKEWS